MDLKDEEFVDFVEVTGVKPDIAEHILVVGTPISPDLEQTVSEGIISGFRFFPDSGELYQITAPISICKGNILNDPVYKSQLHRWVILA